MVHHNTHQPSRPSSPENRTRDIHTFMMSLLALPAEVRTRIYDFCFPPPRSHIQLIPYRASSPDCHLNLPLSLYRVCKFITAELPPLSTKVQSLDFLYLIKGASIGGYSRPEDGPRKDDDTDLHRFQNILRFAQRVRLRGAGKPTTAGRSIQSASRRLYAGSKCALRVLEVQPILWRKRLVVQAITSCLGPLTIHPDVAEGLKIQLIRDDEGEGPNDDMDVIEDWLRGYQELHGKDICRRFSANGTPYDS